MKVLQIINSLGTGGAEKLLLDTIPLYVENGIKMDVLVLWNNNHQFINALKELNCCKVIILKNSTNYKDIYNPLAIIKLRKILKDYDIAHVHLFPAQYFVPLANLLNRNKTKLVFTEHSINNNRINNKLFKEFDRLIYRKYNKIIAITSEIKAKFSSILNLDNNVFEIITNGVNLSNVKNAINNDEFNYVKNGDILILQVSAFREGKDQDTVIRTLLDLPENYKLILVGDGIRKPRCEQLVKDLGLDERVIFLGQRMDIPQLMKSVDYIVLSSQYEGLSLASIEGLASGKPFLATNVPGLKEIVDGAGVLFELGNCKQLATKILELENNPELRSKVIFNSVQRAEKYDIKLMIQKHITLYRQVYEN